MSQARMAAWISSWMACPSEPIRQWSGQIVSLKRPPLSKLRMYFKQYLYKPSRKLKLLVYYSLQTLLLNEAATKGLTCREGSLGNQLPFWRLSSVIIVKSDGSVPLLLTSFSTLLQNDLCAMCFLWWLSRVTKISPSLLFAVLSLKRTKVNSLCCTPRWKFEKY